ncbi:MAG: phage tail tape measure protein [Ruminiclostridium sp.]
MAKELTANFSANSSGFSAAVQKLKTDLTNLNKSLDENKKAISETNKKTREYEKELELLKKAEKENGEATKEQKQRMGELETAIAQTRVKAAELKTEQAELKANIKSTTRQLEEQTVSANQSGKSLDTVKSSAKDLGKTLGTTAAGFSALVGAIYSLTHSAASSADSINTLSKQYGLSTEEIQKFKYATDLIDVSLETYVASIARNIRSMTAYQNGTEATVQAYDTLGVAVTEANGKLRDSQTVYNEVISALGKVEDETERDSIAMTILGRNAQQLNPLILGGADALAELGEQAENLGLILPQESLDNLNAFNDKVDTLKANMNGLQMVVGESFANSFDSFFEAGDDFLEFIQQLKADGTLDEMAKGLSDTLATLVNMLKTAIDIGWKFRNAIAAGVVSLITFKTAINIGNIISGTVTAIKSFKTATDAATVSQQIFNATGAANPYVLIATLAATAVSGIITFIATTNNATQSVEELSQAASELSDEAQKSSDKAKTLEEVMSKYEDASTKVQSAAEKTQTLKDLQEQLNSVYDDTREKIDLVNGKYEENIEKITQATEAEQKQIEQSARAAELKYQQMGESAESYTISSNNFDATFKRNQIGVARLLDSKVNNAIFKIGVDGYKLDVTGSVEEKLQAYTEMLKVMEDNNLATEEYADMYSYLVEQQQKYSQLVKERATNLETLNTITNEEIQKTKENTDAGNDNARTVEDISETAKSASENVHTLASEAKNLSAALEEQAENGKISVETALDLIDKGYSQILQIDKETNAIRINAQAYRDLMQAKIDARKVEIQTTISEAREDIINKLGGGWGGLSAFGTMVSGAEAADEEVQSLYNNIQALEAELGVLDNISTSVDTTIYDYNSGKLGESNSKSDNIYSQAAAAYKTEADKKIALIKRELEAKKELRDETIKAIDDEIEARKRLNEDNDLEKQINEVKAQLKYSQLDEFSREQMEKKLQGLYDDKAEKEWQRNAQARKDAANAKYESEQKSYNNQISAINESLKTVQQIMSAMADGSKTVESIVNNDNTRNNTANVNLIGTALTMAQITKAVKDALMDDIVIR